MPGSLPRSLKQVSPSSLKEVSRTYVPEHITGDPLVRDIGGIDTEHNIGTGDFENGATAGDIDIAGNDRYVWRGRYMEDIDVVVATLIAAVTYQAALQTPGGYTQDEIHKGTAVLIKAFAFNVFVIADSLAFSLASASIFVHFWSSIEESRTVVTKLRRYARFITNISIVGMVVAFAAGASVVLTPSRLLHAFTIVCCTCFFLGPIILFLRIMRATINSVLSGIVEKFRRARHYPARSTYV